MTTLLIQKVDMASPEIAIGDPFYVRLTVGDYWFRLFPNGDIQGELNPAHATQFKFMPFQGSLHQAQLKATAASAPKG